jgi:crotonobetainyl-CoA:carnitine CoA-transferase CaiB-like acyl-CoA transferase
MSTAGPLDGIRVVDMSVMISGPLCAMVLADQGADVVKVEAPGLGDLMRVLGSQKNGTTGIYLLNNRGKRSLVVDVKRPEGLGMMRTLLRSADVLIQNFRPEALDRLGLGYDDVAAINDQLVYVSISGYGPDGPNASMRVYDNVIQSASGLVSLQGDARTGEPEVLRTLVCDKVAAYTAAQAITAALFARERGKGGQHITVSMLDAAIAFMWPDGAMDAALLDDDVLRTPTIAANYRVNRLKDGFCTMSVVSEAEYVALCNVLGNPGMVADERFATSAARLANIEAFLALVVAGLADLTTAEFEERARRFQLPAAVSVSLADVHLTSQAVHNEVFVERLHPAAGCVREVRSAPRFSGTPTRLSDPAPSYGQHSVQIADELGLDGAALKAAGVIF